MGNRSDVEKIEEGSQLLLDYRKLRKVAEIETDLVPAIVQDARSKEVLLLAYVNEEALRHSLSRGVATFYSTSRQELWVKGATSGDYLDLQEIRVNCEQNSLLYLVNLRRQGSCHTKNRKGESRFSCYYRKIENEEGRLLFLEE